MTRIALIDGDIIVYRCGFAADKDESPLDFCLKIVKDYINNIIDDAECDNYILYLSPRRTFRDEIATIQPYKGNRDPSKRPKYYGEIKAYLRQRWGARIPKNIEADDALAIRLTEMGDKAVCCSIDKDLLQVPGLHFNFNTKKWNNISPLDGLKHLYTQIIAGDSVDNIKGVPGLGQKRAEKLLQGMTRELPMYEAALKAFLMAGLTLENMHETAQLVYLLRTPDDMWEAPRG